MVRAARLRVQLTCGTWYVAAMTSRIAILVVAVVVAATACGRAVATKRNVLRADLAHLERTRLTGYVGDWTGWTEDTPGQVPRTAVIDEAFLESDGVRDCAVVTMRTFLDRDDTLDQWKALINGAQAYAEGERVSIADYTIHGRRVMVDAVYATPFAAGSVQITQPTEDIWRVVERTARFCQPSAPEFNLELSYQKRHSDPARVLEFGWALR